MTETTKQEPMSDDERLGRAIITAWCKDIDDDTPANCPTDAEAESLGRVARTLLAQPIACEPLTIEEKRRIADSSSSPFVVAHDAALAQYKKCRPAPSPAASDVGWRLSAMNWKEAYEKKAREVDAVKAELYDLGESLRASRTMGDDLAADCNQAERQRDAEKERADRLAEEVGRLGLGVRAGVTNTNELGRLAAFYSDKRRDDESAVDAAIRAADERDAALAKLRLLEDAQTDLVRCVVFELNDKGPNGETPEVAAIRMLRAQAATIARQNNRLEDHATPFEARGCDAARKIDQDAWSEELARQRGELRRASEKATTEAAEIERLKGELASAKGEQHDRLVALGSEWLNESEITAVIMEWWCSGWAFADKLGARLNIAHMEKAERVRKEAASLRPAQGLPAVGEPIEYLAGNDQWLPDAVTSWPGFDTHISHFRIADEGKTWRRVAQPEKPTTCEPSAEPSPPAAPPEPTMKRLRARGYGRDGEACKAASLDAIDYARERTAALEAELALERRKVEALDREIVQPLREKCDANAQAALELAELRELWISMPVKHATDCPCERCVELRRLLAGEAKAEEGKV